MTVRRALVTGGAGFIGSHLVELLLAQGAEVIVVDDLSTGRAENLPATPPPWLRLLRGRVEDVGEYALDGVDAIFHLAASVGVTRVLRDPLDAMERNLNGTGALLKAIAKSRVGKIDVNVPRFVFASTSEVYGDRSSSYERLHEEMPTRIGPTTLSRWSYACSKAMDEFLSFAYGSAYAFPVTVVRYFNVIGPRQAGAHGMVVPRLVRQALAGEPMTVYGTGLQARTFGDVRDVVRATVDLLRTPDARGQVVNVGGDQTVEILELAEKIKDLTGTSSPIELVPYTEAYTDRGYQDVMGRLPDLTKLKRLIGWAPFRTLDETLADIIAFEREATT